MGGNFPANLMRWFWIRSQRCVSPAENLGRWRPFLFSAWNSTSEGNEELDEIRVFFGGDDSFQMKAQHLIFVWTDFMYFSQVLCDCWVLLKRKVLLIFLVVAKIIQDLYTVIHVYSSPKLSYMFIFHIHCIYSTVDLLYPMSRCLLRSRLNPRMRFIMLDGASGESTTFQHALELPDLPINIGKCRFRFSSGSTTKIYKYCLNIYLYLYIHTYLYIYI